MSYIGVLPWSVSPQKFKWKTTFLYDINVEIMVLLNMYIYIQNFLEMVDDIYQFIVAFCQWKMSVPSSFE